MVRKIKSGGDNNGGGSSSSSSSTSGNSGGSGCNSDRGGSYCVGLVITMMTIMMLFVHNIKICFNDGNYNIHNEGVIICSYILIMLFWALWTSPLIMILVH